MRNRKIQKASWFKNPGHYAMDGNDEAHIWTEDRECAGITIQRRDMDEEEFAELIDDIADFIRKRNQKKK